MSSLNQCSFIGRIGKKPEIRSMQNGKQVASFSLAVDQSYKKDGQKVEKTEWVNIVVFSEGLVKVIESYTCKGSLLYVSGTLQTRKWTDNTGVDRYRTEIVLQGFNAVLQLLDSRKEANEEEKPEKQEKEPINQEYDRNDEIPF